MTPALTFRLRRAALPALAFAVFHAVAIAAVVAGELVASEMAFGRRALTVIAIFAVGGALGGLTAFPLAYAFSAGRGPTSRFSAMLVLLALGTSAFSALAYFLVFRSQYQDIDVFDLQTVFVGASAAFTFVASGLPMLLPAGLVLLLLECAAFMRWSALRPGAASARPRRLPSLPRAEPP